MLSPLIGFAIVFFGTFFEGEVVLVIAGFAVRDHPFLLPVIIFAGFLGSLGGDQFFYWIGHHRGRQYLDNRPHLQDNAEKIHDWLHRYKYLVMSGFRFLYGFRMVTPFIIGTSQIPYWEFTLFNVIGAAVWSIVVSILGFAFGNTLELFIKNVHHYQKEAIIFIVFICFGLWIWSFIKKQMLYRKKRHSRKK